MRNVPERLHTIHHPLIREAYLKKDYSNQRNFKDVLVIEAISSDAKHKNYQMDLLMDLPTIQHMAEDEVGHIDRIDIVRH
jgi:hypothetical protein